MTRRERMERRLEKRLDWAESRDRKVAAVAQEAEKYRGDWAFNTQPGHIPQRARLIARQEKAFGDYKMAEHHRSKAAGIESQLENSIYSDDPDAVESLGKRIADLEADREAYKLANSAFKKGGAEAMRAAVGDALAAEGLKTLQIQPFYKVPFPPYSLTNIGGNIRRLKARLVDIRARQARAEKAEAAGGMAVEDFGEYVRVIFAEKPERGILEALRSAGFSWGAGYWSGRKDNLPPMLKEGNEP